MRELYKISLSEAVDIIVSEYAESRKISKSLAKKLFVNAIIYNVVADEIESQMDFLRDEEA